MLVHRPPNLCFLLSIYYHDCAERDVQQYLLNTPPPPTPRILEMSYIQVIEFNMHTYNTPNCSKMVCRQQPYRKFLSLQEHIDNPTWDSDSATVPMKISNQ